MIYLAHGIHALAKTFDFEQGTEPWFDIRKGVITASVVKALTADKGLGKGAETLAKQMAMEIVTDFETELVQTYYTEKGTELEPVARRLYTKKTGRRVKQVGFVLIKEVGIGVSPDGLIGIKGGVEIKCPKYNTHMDTLMSQLPDPKYIPQMQMQMMVCGLKWIDFVSYNEDVPEKHRIIICRLDADPAFQEMLFNRMTEFRVMIDKWVKLLS